MVDVAAGFGIDQRDAGVAIEMAREIGKLVGEDLEDRGIDLNSVDAPGAEVEPGKNVAAAADADNGHIGRRLHQIGGVDDIVLQVGELADIAIVPGDDGRRIGVDIEALLLDFHLRRVDEAPTDRSALAVPGHPDARVGVPALEQRSKLLIPLCPEDAQMAFAGNIESDMDDGCGSQGERNGTAQPPAACVAASHDRPACAGGKGSDPQCGAYRIDHEEDEDDAEASKRRP